MNYSQKNQDDFEDILRNLVPYDEAEEHAQQTPQEEELEIFDMDAWENDLSEDLTSDNFFITRPTKKEKEEQVATPREREDAQLIAEKTPESEVVQSTPETSSLEMTPKQVEIEPSQIVERIGEPEESNSPADLEASPNDTLEFTPEFSPEPLPNCSPIQHLGASPWHAYESNQEHQDSTSPCSEAVQPAEPEPIGNIEVPEQETAMPYEYTNSAPSINAEQNNGCTFTPIPDVFDMPQDNSWSLEEYFGDSHEDASPEGDLYVADESNSGYMSTDNSLPYQDTTHIQNNPECIPSGYTPEDVESPEEQLPEEFEEPVQEASSVDELFKDCPPIDPSLFCYGSAAQQDTAFNSNFPANNPPTQQEGILFNNFPANDASTQQEGILFNNFPANDAPTQQEGILFNNFPANDAHVEQEDFSFSDNYFANDAAAEQEDIAFDEYPVYSSEMSGNNESRQQQVRPNFIPSSPFPQSTQPSMENPYILPSTDDVPVMLETVEESIPSHPTSDVQMLFCGSKLLLSSAMPSITNSAKLLPQPLKLHSLQAEIHTSNIRQKSTEELVGLLIKAYPLSFSEKEHPLNFLITKNAETLCAAEVRRTEARPILECNPALPQEINKALLQNNWAEGLFLATKNAEHLESVRSLYAEHTTNTKADQIRTLLSTGCSVPLELVQTQNARENYLAVLKSAVQSRSVPVANALVDTLLHNGQAHASIVCAVISGHMEKCLPWVFDINTLLICSKLKDKEEGIRVRTKEVLKNLRVLNKKRAQEIYRENKDIFTRSEKNEIEECLGIEASSWGLQGIINAVDKGITRMVSTPTPTPAPTPKPELPISSGISLGSGVSVPAGRIVKKKIASRPIIPMGKPTTPAANSTSIPIPGMNESSIPMPTKPSMPFMTMPTETKISEPATNSTSIPMPVRPSMPFKPSMPMPVKPAETAIPMPAKPEMSKPAIPMPMPVKPAETAMPMPARPNMTMPARPNMPMPVKPAETSMPMPARPSMPMPVKPAETAMPMPARPNMTMPAIPMPMPVKPAETSMPMPARPSMPMPARPSMPMPARPTISSTPSMAGSPNTSHSTSQEATSASASTNSSGNSSDTQNSPQNSFISAPSAPTPAPAPAQGNDKTDTSDSAAEDNIDYKKLYSDKSRYQIVDDKPQKGSWLGYIPGVGALTGMVKKLAGQNIPVIELSQDTIFILDKKLNKWITVDSKTFKPIKICASQESMGSSVEQAPKPIPLPVITGKMPKRGPDGKVDFGPIGTSLEARYGKPMIQSIIDTSVQEAPVAFPTSQNMYSTKNAKVFIPKFPVEDTTPQ
ncbi:hypothetical protein NERG_02151 [Nematocida ausubeli]|uniref:Uncharacterized protein n=1 Tax=Nematocida ausubeli (strain ATCC PRA-371 / ERTm2) TaxID=1913371 RepID=H8ZEY2_NEMA1|nr:hypothetical protein NERG_02151 [Nematocida ausubeli]